MGRRWSAHSNSSSARRSAPALLGALVEGLLGAHAPAAPDDPAKARAQVQMLTLFALRALGVVDARARPRRADGDAAAEREILEERKRSGAGHCTVAAAIHSVTARSAVPGLPLCMWASNTASCASADVPEPTMARQRLISAVQPSAAASAAVSQITRSTISATVKAPSSAAKVACTP